VLIYCEEKIESQFAQLTLFNPMRNHQPMQELSVKFEEFVKFLENNSIFESGPCKWSVITRYDDMFYPLVIDVISIQKYSLPLFGPCLVPCTPAYYLDALVSIFSRLCVVFCAILAQKDLSEISSVKVYIDEIRDYFGLFFKSWTECQLG
jgi:hypothetical protein